MAKSERMYKMGLSDFHRYLDDKGDELAACYKQMQQVQTQFRDIFKREMAAWQESFSFCYPRLLAQRQEMPQKFAQHIDRVEAEEQERIRKEIAALKKEIQESQARMDELLAKAQTATETLRVANPEINDREEHLKALVVKYQDEYAQAFEEMDPLDDTPMGWLTNYSKIRRLKKVQKTAKKKQAEALRDLRLVRQGWLDKVQETGDTQAELREEWQKLGIRISQAQGEHDHKADKFDILAEQAAIQRVLEELDNPPEDVPSELGETLAELSERNKVRWRYEAGLEAVGQALGLTKAMGQSLKRFESSVGTVLQEQRRYNLKRVNVLVPHSVAVINEIWKTVGDKVKAEEYMGAHPTEFSHIAEKYIVKRLANESIQGFFESLGEALNRATAAWD